MSKEISIHKLDPTNKELLDQIAHWYLNEWSIPVENTIKRLSAYPNDDVLFQFVLSKDGQPIATAGLYNHVSLIDREPKFKSFKPWLALVYTAKENRRQGYGAMLCEKIQTAAKESGYKELFLFTDTAESLYKKLGWQVLERLEIKGRNIVVMKKEL